MAKSPGQAAFELHCRAHRLAPVAEYRFHPTRRWRFDYAFPGQMLAIEIEGGHHAGGRHTRGTGFENDIMKYEAAMLLGWDVYRCTTQMATSGHAIDTVLKLLEIKAAKSQEARPC